MKRLIIGAGLALGALGAGVAALWKMFGMPGESFSGPLPPPCADHDSMVANLRRIVQELAGEFGERHLHHHQDALEAAATFIEAELREAGLKPRRQSWQQMHDEVHNIEVEFRGRIWPKEILVIGAHYDSGRGTPGANDNASGVAAALMLACRMASAGVAPARTVRFVFFVNEEEPFFQSESMGSVVYARRCAERGEQIRAMLALETLGYYSDAPGSQHYPEDLGLGLPDVGNFVAFVGNLESADLVRDTLGAFRARAEFPSHGVALPESVAPIGWSDHWAFWQEGYPALMVTDTAPYRYPHYHTREDTPDKLDYDRFARVVEGLAGVLEELAEP